MTKAELIEQIKHLPDNMEIVIRPASWREAFHKIESLSKIVVDNPDFEETLIVIETVDDCIKDWDYYKEIDV